MNKLGFGLERIGLTALSKPRLFGLLALVIIVVFAAFIPTVKFNGNVTAIIPRTSEVFLDYETQHRDFRNFSRDVAVIVRSPDLLTAEGLEALREMQIELSIAEGVAAAFSMFSIPDFEESNGNVGRFFPPEIENDAEAQAVMQRLMENFPQAVNLVSLEENVALILVALDIDSTQGNDASTFALFETFVEEVKLITPNNFEVLYAGLTPIGITILDTLVKDQLKLTLLGLLAGAMIAFVFFRCPSSAILCAVPPILTAVLSIGVFGITRTPITYLTTILPTLALILAYADGIVLHHRWMRLNREGDKNFDTYRENLRQAVQQVGPATALTSITTALALSSFGLSSSEALREFAWLGVILVGFAFLSVIIVLPILGLWFAHKNLLRNASPSKTADRIGNLANSVYGRAATVISAAGFILVGLMFYSHYKLEPDYRITDYLPRNSDTLEAERVANDVFGGRSLVFFSIPVVEDGGIASNVNRKRLGEVTDTLTQRFGETGVFSMHAFLKSFDEAAAGRIAQRLQTASEQIRQGYISKDDSKMLISLRISSSQSIAESAKMIDELRQTLAVLPYADEITLTGFPVLLAIEFTDIINELRLSLLIAIGVGILLIGIASRSIFYALVAAIPNMFPVLFVELLIYFNGGNINVTEVVALTIAFGIAIDNAVHIINAFNREQAKGDRDFADSLKAAVNEVGPALAGSTLIICTATAVILTSTLPILTIVGKLIIIILVVALLTNLVLLPANILTLGRLTGRMKQG